MIKQRSLLFRSSEEDLYRAAEELSEPQQDEPAPRPLLESTRQYSEITHGFIWPASGAGGWGGWRGGRWETKTTFVFVVSCKIHTGLLCLGRHVLRLVSLFCSVVKVEDRCSLAPAVDILSYSEREWKGNTAKSALIRKVGVCSCSQHWRQLLFHFMSTNSVCRAAPGLQRDVTQVWECEESEGGQLLCTEGHAVPGPVPQQQAACVAPRGGRWRHGKYTQSEPRSHFHWL